MRQNSLSSSTRVRQVARLSYLRNFRVGSRLAVRHDQHLPPSERMLSTSPNDTKGGIEVRSASLNAALGDQPQIGTVPLLISGGVCGAEARPPELLLFLLRFVSRSSSKGTLHLHSRVSHVALIRRSGKSGFDRCRRVKPCVKKWSIKRQNRRYSSASIHAITAIFPRLHRPERPLPAGAQSTERLTADHAAHLARIKTARSAERYGGEAMPSPYQTCVHCMLHPYAQPDEPG